MASLFGLPQLARLAHNCEQRLVVHVLVRLLQRPRISPTTRSHNIGVGQVLPFRHPLAPIMVKVAAFERLEFRQRLDPLEEIARVPACPRA
jgi:hypothetical protein